MSRYKCIQRVGASKQTTIQDLMDSAKKYPGSWDSIMLFTPADFNDTPEESEAKLLKFAEDVRIAKKQGLSVQFNIGYVLGHGDFQTKRPAIVRHMVGPEGETGVVSVCPRSAELKERVSAVFARFARLEPECMWIDDDFRVYDHSPIQSACFCDECIAAFNKQYHHTFTREQLNAELLTDHFPKDNTIRREWLYFTHEGMTELLRSIAQAVHAVNPDIIMGLMTAGVEYDNFAQGNFKDYANALANPDGKVYFRPGAFFYNDQTPFESVKKAFSIAVTNEHSLIKNANSYSEIVICPYFKRGKSHKITAWEAALHIGLGGAEGVTFEAIQNMIAEMNGYIARMDQERPFLSALSDSLADHKQIGFYPYFSEEQWVYAETASHLREMHDLPFGLSHQLLKIGVPLTPSADNALGVILGGNLVKAMPNAELEKWLGKAIYADAEAVGYIDTKLGRHALGVEITGPVTDNSEVFTDDALNAPYTGFIRGGHWAGYGNGCADMKCVGATALSVSSNPSATPGPLESTNLTDDCRACAKSNNALPVGTAVYNTPEGGRAAVLARAPWSDDIQSFPKSCQILNILDWLCGGMPVRIDTDCRIGQALWQGSNDLICFLFSMDFDDAENVTLRLKTPAKAERLLKDGTWQYIGEGSKIIIDKIEGFTCAPIRLF
ncbi:MAG: hypothetical protein IKC46_04680 [Lachnospiraceae bacterium]|nr:hypothetical protein [Lachnospiraceae bacterium]